MNDIVFPTKEKDAATLKRELDEKERLNRVDKYLTIPTDAAKAKLAAAEQSGSAGAVSETQQKPVGWLELG